LAGGTTNLFPEFLTPSDMRERLNSIGNWTAYSIPVNNKLKTKLWK